jgi:hypothetical protein
MEDLVRSEVVAPFGQRCADCGVMLEKPQDQGAICLECGEPLCRNCASLHLKREEAMVCATCWESDSLTGEEE